MTEPERIAALSAVPATAQVADNFEIWGAVYTLMTEAIDEGRRSVTDPDWTAKVLVDAPYNQITAVVSRLSARVAELEAEVERLRKETVNAAHLLALMNASPTERHSLIYTNYRGETSKRELYLVGIIHGSTKWHPEPQLLLTAFDCDKSAYRDFAVADFDFRAALRANGGSND